MQLKHTRSLQPSLVFLTQPVSQAGLWLANCITTTQENRDEKLTVLFSSHKQNTRQSVTGETLTSVCSVIQLKMSECEVRCGAAGWRLQSPQQRIQIRNLSVSELLMKTLNQLQSVGWSVMKSCNRSCSRSLLLRLCRTLTYLHLVVFRLGGSANTGGTW